VDMTGHLTFVPVCMLWKELEISVFFGQHLSFSKFIIKNDIRNSLHVYDSRAVEDWMSGDRATPRLRAASCVLETIQISGNKCSNHHSIFLHAGGIFTLQKVGHVSS
jgi:hypothetical protein